MSFARFTAARATWVFIAVLALTLLFAPALIGRTVTGPDQQTSFLTAPWNGWTFAGTMLRHSADAEAASPGAALAVAQKTWPARKGAPVATSAHLVYTPRGARLHFTGLGENREYEVKLPTTDRPLMWTIEGHHRGHGSQGVIGVLDYSSAKVLWDVRDADAQTHIEALSDRTEQPDVNHDTATAESASVQREGDTP